MNPYPLLLHQRRLIEMLKPYIEQNLIKDIWTVHEIVGDLSIDGLDVKGELEAKGWDNVTAADIKKFVDIGLLRPLADQPGRYMVDFNGVLDAINKRL
jgi:hypothetical protein